MDIEKLSLNDSGYVSCFDKVIKIGVLGGYRFQVYKYDTTKC